MLEVCVLSFTMTGGEEQKFAIPDCSQMTDGMSFECRVKEFTVGKWFAACVEVDADGKPLRVLYSGPAYEVKET